VAATPHLSFAARAVRGARLCCARVSATSSRPPLDARAIAYIAREAARRYGPIEPDLPRKIRRNVQRNFAVSVALDDVAAWLAHYKAVYLFAAARLGQHLRPAAGRFADPADVDFAGLLRALGRRYPREDRELLGLIANYVVYYEYLR
jgi:hypothetical protein